MSHKIVISGTQATVRTTCTRIGKRRFIYQHTRLGREMRGFGELQDEMQENSEKPAQ